MTNHETRALHAVLTVTVETRADGIYYVDQADLARHVKGWLEDALCDRDDIEEVSVADAVLPVLLAPVDQAAVLREAADDLATAFGDPMAKHIGILGASHLRRRAREIEAAQAGEDQPETPLEKRLRYSERRNDELRAECKRRGKRVLEQSEKIIALEREIDEVRRQLGAEILRAGQAEAELRRATAEPGPVAGEQQNEIPEAEVLRCVCGDPVQLMDETDPTSWIHSPGSDTRCLEARPRCPHCQMPHDLTPGSVPVAVCESVRQRIAEAERLHGEGDHRLCARVDCEVLREQPAAGARQDGAQP